MTGNIKIFGDIFVSLQMLYVSRILRTEGSTFATFAVIRHGYETSVSEMYRIKIVSKD